MTKSKCLRHYIFLTLFFFLSLTIVYTLSRGDTNVNFGFSYAISKGEIPYKDFNMVITPFAPILYSFGLIFCKNIIIFYLEQAILLTIMFYYLEKLLGKKSILLLFLYIIPYPIAMSSIIFPGYNYLILMLFIIFLYYHREKKNNYILGILLGLIFCTKQTIGTILFFPTFYYLWKDKKKFMEMLIGYIIPITLLFLYLGITNSLSSFINLCFLGLFDFQKSNHQIDCFYFLLFLFGIGYMIYQIIKKPSKIELYYVICLSFIILPIIDYYHVSIFLGIVFYYIVENVSIKENVYKYIHLIIISIGIIWTMVSIQYLEEPVIRSFPNFSYIILKKEYAINTKELFDYTNTIDKEIIYFMRGSENYFYKIMHNDKINYFDLPNYGNYGYNGIDMMKKKIDMKKDVYFILDRVLINNKDKNQQYIKELGLYVKKKSEKIKEIGNYDIYYKK